jgi:hypothetical protein
MVTTVYNEHIAKIAALPSFENKYYFRGVGSEGSAVDAATYGNMPGRCANMADST